MNLQPNWYLVFMWINKAIIIMCIITLSVGMFTMKGLTPFALAPHLNMFVMKLMLVHLMMFTFPCFDITCIRQPYPIPIPWHHMHPSAIPHPHPLTSHASVSYTPSPSPDIACIRQPYPIPIPWHRMHPSAIPHPHPCYIALRQCLIFQSWGLSRLQYNVNVVQHQADLATFCNVYSSVYVSYVISGLWYSLPCSYIVMCFFVNSHCSTCMNLWIQYTYRTYK